MTIVVGAIKIQPKISELPRMCNCVLGLQQINEEYCPKEVFVSPDIKPSLSCGDTVCIKAMHWVDHVFTL